jgi:aminopeptidase N
VYDAQGQSFALHQNRFFEQKSQGVNDTTRWYIPINFATSDNPNFDDTTITHYFDDLEMEKRIPATPSTWFVFNKQQWGYYRVDYQVSNWNALKTVLNSNGFTAVHVMNRAQLIDDSFALANAGYHSDYDLAFGIMSYLQRETDFFPFYPAYRYLNNLYTVFGRVNSYLNVNIF